MSLFTEATSTLTITATLLYQIIDEYWPEFQGELASEDGRSAYCSCVLSQSKGFTFCVPDQFQFFV